MRILIVKNGLIPVHLYGGTERVIWGLGKELKKLGHEITYLVKKGSTCDFAKIIEIDPQKNIIDQIPKNYDLIHFHTELEGMDGLNMPYVFTMHGNLNDQRQLDRNTIFVSQNHANRFGSDSFVYNGLDWSEYSTPNLNNQRSYFHFLGNAAWRVKNVRGAIGVIKATPSERLKVLGGYRLNFKMGFRLTLSPRIGFEGMVGGSKKFQLINSSKGLVFPVLWNEPFGLAITESLYYGCPVFGTPYGSLPELVHQDVGFLSNKQSELTNAVLESDQYSRQRCNEYAQDEFNSLKMALAYLKKYEIVLSGGVLNDRPPQLMELPKQKFLDWN